MQQNVRSSAPARVGTAGREKQQCRTIEQRHATLLGTGQQDATPLVRPPVQYREIPTAVRTQLGPTHQYTMLAAMTNKQKGVLDYRDFRKSLNYQYSDASTFQPEQRAGLPYLFENRENVEVAAGSVQQAWCEQRARYPLPTDTETVSATRKAHVTAQTSLSRGPD